MGRVKDEWIDAQVRGWVAPERSVCAACVDDAHLKGLIERSSDARKCHYCGTEFTEPEAAPVDVIMPGVMGALLHRYAEPAGAGVPYESQEGGYLVELTDTEDALLSLPFECNDELFQDVVAGIAHINDSWVPAGGGHWATAQESDELTWAWNSFVEEVTHRRRYFFGQGQDDHRPPSFPGALSKVATVLDLVTTIPPDTALFRVRVRKAGDTWCVCDEQMSAPPSGFALAGRMNPAGISYLYLALDEQTAIRDVVRRSPCQFAVAQFRATSPLQVLDLSVVPPLPSPFDHGRLMERDLIEFLRGFRDDIGKPVEKDGREHVDYVPSQIVCEYFSTVFRRDDPIDGILYSSSVREGGKNLVLFPRAAYPGPVEWPVEFIDGKFLERIP